MRLFVLSAFALTVLTACQPGVAPLTEEDIAALNALRAAYRQGAIAGNPDVLSAVYAEDAVLWGADKPATEGAEEPLTAVGNARKQADGTWLWALDISNTDAPLPRPE